MKISTIDRAQAGQDSSRSGYFDGEVHVQSITGPGDSDEIEVLAELPHPIAVTAITNSRGAREITARVMHKLRQRGCANLG